MNRRRRGNIYETLVCSKLIPSGFTIVERNYYKCGIGEIDIIAVNKSSLYFIEVRSRNLEYSGGMPEESLGRFKMLKFKRCIRYYMACEGRIYQNLKMKIVFVSAVKDKNAVRLKAYEL